MEHKRETNFDILRIISMLMVVALHFNNFGKVGVNLGKFGTPLEINFFNLVEYACIIAVNLFVLLSGYFMSKKEPKTIKISKVIQLWIEAIFYSVGLYLIITICYTKDFSWEIFFKRFSIFLYKKYWFIAAYLCLYLCTPFINMLIQKLKKKEYIALAVVLTIIVVIFPIKGNAVFEAAGGYSFGWFVYLYIIGGFFRLHNTKKINKLLLAIVYCITVMLKFFFMHKANATWGYELEYNNWLIVIESIVFFLFFKNWNIKNKIVNKISTFFAPSVLGVYLIHEQDNMRSLLWGWLKPYIYLGGGVRIYLELIIDVFGIFIACCLVEKLRQFIFNKFRTITMVDKCYEWIDKKWSSIFENVEKVTKNN